MRLLLVIRCLAALCAAAAPPAAPRSSKAAAIARAVQDGSSQCGGEAQDQDGSCEASATNLIQKVMRVVERPVQLSLDRVGPTEMELDWLENASSPSTDDSSSKSTLERDSTGKEHQSFFNRVSHAKGDHAAKVLARGQLMGLSRDAWIVQGIMAACLFASVIIILSTTRSAVGWRAKWLGNDVPVGPDGSIVRPTFPVSPMQRFFRKDLNEHFARTADISFRVGLVCAFCGLTYWIEELNFINEQGWTMAYAVEIICFSAYTNLGNTAMLCWFNFLGTALPVLNTLLIFGVAGNPIGPALFTPVWWFGMVNFIVFCYIFLGLNVNLGVRMFALSWQAYWSMCFLNPHNPDPFSVGFSDIILEGAAIGPLIGTLFAVVLSLLCVCPWVCGYAIVGLGDAQETAMSLAWAEGQQWRRMISYHAGAPSTLGVDQLGGEARLLRTEMDALETHMAATWWECFDLGKAGRVRAHIGRMQQMLVPVHMWRRGVIEVLATEEFSQEHAKLMSRVATPMQELASNANTLFYRAVKMGIGGFSRSSCRGAEAAVADLEERELKRSLAATQSSQRNVAEEFAKAREEVYGLDTLAQDAIGEHFFGFALSAYAQHVEMYAEYILSDKRQEGVGVLQACREHLVQCLSFNPIKFQLRVVPAFFGAWFVGYFGISGGIMPVYSSSVAGTTAFLLASQGHAGSAIMRSIARFQGVAGGYIIGSLLFALFVKHEMCNPLWTSSLGFISTVILVFFSFFLYLSSSTFGYVGVLMAAMGTGPLMATCKTHLSGDAVYEDIMYVALAIIFVTIPDLIVGNESTGHLAVTAYAELVSSIGASFKDLLGVGQAQGQRSSTALKAMRDSEDVDSVSDRHRVEVIAKFAEASGLGDEAPLEPRWYRVPFKVAGWKECLGAAEQMGIKLCVMEYAVSLCEKVTKGKSRSQVLELLVASPTLGKTLDSAMDSWKRVFDLSEVLLMHETNAPLDMSKKFNGSEVVHGLPGLDKNITSVITEVCAKLPKQEARDSLAADDFCLLAVLLMMSTGTLDQVNRVLKACFQMPEIAELMP